MKSSCVSHEREPLIIIRQSYVDFCNGNHCAAALISFFEYWHNIKLDMQKKAQFANSVAANHGEEPTQDTSLYQFHTADDLIDGMVGLFGITKIRDAIEQLKELGVISVHRNPNPRYKFDNTRYFLFNPDVLKMPHRPVKNNTSSVENDGRCVENNRPSVKNDTTITETPTETSTEKNKKTNAREEKTESNLYVSPSRRLFQITQDWKPEPNTWAETLKVSQHLVKPEQFTDYTLAEFIRTNLGKEEKTEHDWQRFYVNALARGYIKPMAENTNIKKPNPHIYQPERTAQEASQSSYEPVYKPFEPLTEAEKTKTPKDAVERMRQKMRGAA